MTRVIMTINPKNKQYLTNEHQGDYDTCTSKYHSKPWHKGIDGMHFGVELLNEHTETPLGYLTQRSPTPRAKCTRSRSVWENRKNDMVFRINHLVREVLIEVIFSLLITEPHKIKNKRIRRKRIRTMTFDRVLGRNRLFRCHKKETKLREKKRNRETQQKIRHGKEKKNKVQCMSMLCAKEICIVGKNPIQTIALTLVNQAHDLECMKI